MNKKGEISIATIMVAFIAILVGVILFQTIAQSVGESVNTIAVANESMDTVVNDTTQYLTNYKSISSVVIYNETGDAIVGATNYTITNNVIHPTTGDLCVSILPDAPAPYLSAWQVSGTAQPLTYISESGGRAMANLIPIFFALLLVAVALHPVGSSKLMDLLGK